MNKGFLTNWKLRKIDAAGMGLCIVGVLLFHLSGIRPILRRRENLVAQEQQLKAQRRSELTLDERAAALRDTLAGVRRALTESHVKLQPAGQINRRIARLADLASGSGLKVNQIQPGKASRRPKHVTVPIRLLGSGSYRAWAAFLHNLAEGFPDTSVHSFELSGNPGTRVAPAEFQIDLVWYAAADRAASGK